MYYTPLKHFKACFQNSGMERSKPSKIR